MQEIMIISNRRNELIDITSEVEDIIEDEKIKNGFAVIYVPHTTAGITINEGADPSVKEDILHTLEKIIPENNDYHHLEGNSDAHIKASIFGSSILVLIKNNRILLGTWQHIFFYEGDGPRTRKVIIDCFSK